MQFTIQERKKVLRKAALRDLKDFLLGILGMVFFAACVLILFSSLAYATRAGVVQQLIAEEDPEWVLIYEYRDEDGQWQKVIMNDNGKMTDRLSCLSYRRFIINLSFHEHQKANCYIKGEEHDK